MVLTGLACCLILLQLDDRGRFAVKNGGWEGPDGVGSPMAFLLGLMFEVFWFGYFFLTAMWGLRMILLERDQRRLANQTLESEVTGSAPDKPE